MARDHFILPTAPSSAAITVRLGATADAAGNMIQDQENFKLVKMVGESRYNLCAAGDPIEACIVAIEPGTQNGWSIGSVGCTKPGDKMYVLADGLQATPGTGTIAMLDYVVCGSVTAKGTATPTQFPKVCKATTQTAGSTDFRWRVVSFGTGGVGTVGATMVIERV